jgi:hypothetical protein
MPLRLSAEAVSAINTCTNAPALGAMAGAARSFWGAAGAIAVGPLVGAALWALGWNGAAAVAFLAVAPAALATIETRRRALQWQSVIEARLTALGPATA